jgi:hypothetical protein
MSSKTKLLLSPEMAGPHKVGISSAIPTDEIGVFRYQSANRW